jgi:hypothetical protein
MDAVCRFGLVMDILAIIILGVMSAISPNRLRESSDVSEVQSGDPHQQVAKA